MTAFSQFADAWLAWIVAASWQLCPFICFVAVASWGLRPWSARLRYGLWLLVLAKVFLPPTLSAPWSLGNMPFNAVIDRTALPWHRSVTGTPPVYVASTATDRGSQIESRPSAPYLPGFLTYAWVIGCVGLWGTVGYRYHQLLRSMSASESVDEGPLRILLEETALGLKLKRTPELFTTNEFTSPFLCGVFCPRIVVPQPLIEKLSDDELRAVVLHELVHWKRRDPWVGWLQLVAQGLFWFHPLVWWANSQLRHARENACDESVLQLERILPQQYGEALVRTLTASRGRSLVAGSLVGVFERGTKLQN